MTPAQIRELLQCTTAYAHLALIEGAMGLYDGLDSTGSTSSAELAKITQTPVILVIDVTRMTRTAAALVKGCQVFDPEVNIVGIILNRVRGPRQYEVVRQSIEEACHLPVIGAIPTEAQMTIPDRHLGLLSNTEDHEAEVTLDAIAEVITHHVDLDALLTLAATAPTLLRTTESELSIQPQLQQPQLQQSQRQPQQCLQLQSQPHANSPLDLPTIAVIRDDAFCFYYSENLEALERAGARLVFVNSMTAPALPADINALYIGGGFPEVFARELAAQEGFRASIREQANAGLPVYAECGGLMYLGRALTYQGTRYEMTGALPFETVMDKTRQAHGYAILTATEDNPWFAKGEQLVGHEFHHSRVISADPALKLGFAMERGHGIDGHGDGFTAHAVLATYLHVNALASPLWATRLVEQAQRHQLRAEAQM
jgi:cobyrinic acid a,c-diamide synthase